MSNLELIKGSCVDQKTDAIVNAANRYLMAGGGVCGAIFARAGGRELAEACSKHKTPLKDGQAVITPSFGITNATHIIHAVGPDFGSTPEAFKQLFEAYYNSLVSLKDNGLHSIAFPLISSGIFGGNLEDPVGESAKQCIRAYESFTGDFPDHDVEVKLCAFSDGEMTKAGRVFEKMGYN